MARPKSNNVQINISIPIEWKKELENLARIYSVEEGETITLQKDCELPATGYDKAITYDLNGHTLTAQTFAGYSAKVKDSSAGKGLLKVEKGNLILSSNEYLAGLSRRIGQNRLRDRMDCRERLSA